MIVKRVKHHGGNFYRKLLEDAEKKQDKEEGLIKTMSGK